MHEPISSDMRKDDSPHFAPANEAPVSTTEIPLNPEAKSFTPSSNEDCNNNIAKFFMKRDLLSSRLTTFDDNVEFFAFVEGYLLQRF
jgi:hypothetical protein